MTIKIFNDDPNGNYIFPVLTTGKGTPDIWLQAIFKVPSARAGIDTYARTKNYRIFINDLKGIAPGKRVFLTLPLYTRIAANVDPKLPDRYIDWWNGGTIQLYTSKNATPPRALTEALRLRPDQKKVTPYTGAALPTCAGCAAAVSFYSDTSDLPKGDPSQLLEYTLGARVQQVVKNPAIDPQNTLDLRNVDFDVSYVNLAYLPAAMGPVDNDQVGYVGSPKSINSFQSAITKFLAAYPDWPQFVKVYANGQKETLNKVPSPLEVFSRITPGSLPPPDLTPPKNGGHWPRDLWDPFDVLRESWIKWAGKVRADGTSIPGACTKTAAKNTFCDGIVEVKNLLLANFRSYRAVFPSKCEGRPITLTDDIMISHVYGWSPFVEAAQGTGKGCPPKANLLQDTGNYDKNNYAEYARVKLLFDKLNYGLLSNSKYVFNPWVKFIHGEGFIGAPNVYAYSVDDAVGNIQADGLGFIVDVGSTKNLENRLPATAPITVNYAIGSQSIKMTRYRICKNDVSRERVVNPAFSAFVVSANNPENCPIYFYDNKATPQLYAFRISQKPPFKLFAIPADAGWSAETSKPIDCTDNAGGPPYQPSSKTWCCDKSSSNGVFAYSTPEPQSAHRALQHNVVLHIAEQKTTTPYQACNIR